MIAADFAQLVEWLYTDQAGGFTLGDAAGDLRIEPRTLRAMMHGRRPVAPTVAAVVVRLVAAKSLLEGWRKPPLPMDTLSPETQGELIDASYRPPDQA